MDLLDAKLESAREFGATHAIRADRDDGVDAVKEITGGSGADFAIITVGSASAVEQGFNMIGARGTEVLVGMPEAGASVNLPAGTLAVSEKRVIGSCMGSTRLSYDIPKHVDAYREKRLKLDELITERYPLEEINAAIESMEKGEALRNVITFG